MGIVNFSHPPSLLASFTAPLLSQARGLVRWLRTVAEPQASLARNRPSTITRRMMPQTARTVSRRASSFVTSNPRCAGSGSGPLSVSRLKVVREADSAVRRGGAGRMVMSGRMADVCAELDRMVLSETARCSGREHAALERS